MSEQNETVTEQQETTETSKSSGFSSFTRLVRRIITISRLIKQQVTQKLNDQDHLNVNAESSIVGRLQSDANSSYAQAAFRLKQHAAVPVITPDASRVNTPLNQAAYNPISNSSPLHMDLQPRAHAQTLDKQALQASEQASIKPMAEQQAATPASTMVPVPHPQPVANPALEQFKQQHAIANLDKTQMLAGYMKHAVVCQPTRDDQQARRDEMQLKQVQQQLAQMQSESQHSAAPAA